MNLAYPYSRQSCPRKIPGCGVPWEITAAAHNLGALEAGLKLRVPTLASVSLLPHTSA